MLITSDPLSERVHLSKLAGTCEWAAGSGGDTCRAAHATLGFSTREPSAMSGLEQPNLTRVAPKAIVSRSSFYRALQHPTAREA